CGAGEQMPVIGMFLGGAGLADTMLYCREKIYPLGLPNGLSHALTALAVLARLFLRLKAGFLPPHPSQVAVSWCNSQTLSGRFSLLAVTTLDKLLLSSELSGRSKGSLRLVAIDERPASLLRAFFANLSGQLGQSKLSGVHYEESDEISIEGESKVILDGETFRSEIGRPIFLKLAQPLSFVRIAA
ncbi:MAG: diacylglycerol kinase, partial [Sphingomicrobium sp.]